MDSVCASATVMFMRVSSPALISKQLAVQKCLAFYGDIQMYNIYTYICSCVNEYIYLNARATVFLPTYIYIYSVSRHSVCEQLAAHLVHIHHIYTPVYVHYIYIYCIYMFYIVCCVDSTYVSYIRTIHICIHPYVYIRAERYMRRLVYIRNMYVYVLNHNPPYISQRICIWWWWWWCCCCCCSWFP